MPYLLDTNHGIVLLNKRSLPLAARLAATPPDQVWLCSVVKEELLHGAHKYGDPAERLAILVVLFSLHQSASYNDEAANEAVRIRHELEGAGKVIGPRDLQIAGLALSRGWTLVTANTREFSRVNGLKLEDWTQLGTARLGE